VEGFHNKTILAVLAISALLTNFQFFSRNFCIKATLEEDNFISKRPQTSILFLFMRLATSCCFRGLLSPLTFQQYNKHGVGRVVGGSPPLPDGLLVFA
jgi:hypothetical protein